MSLTGDIREPWPRQHRCTVRLLAQREDHRDDVQIAVGDQVVAVPWKAAQNVRGHLVGSRHPTIAMKFAAQESGENVLLTPEEEPIVLMVVRVCMQRSDEHARDLLPLRNALRDDLERRS
jgi:hypothetical protein